MEHASQLYNGQGAVSTLIGNWQEEAALKEETGTTRTKNKSSKFGDGAADTVYAARQDRAAAEPTHARVIEHSQQLTHSSTSFQNPSVRSIDIGSYPCTSHLGPREALEMQQLWKMAQTQVTPATAASSLETTHQAEFKPHDLTGVSVGARVMKTPDGATPKRDATFLTEAKLMSAAQAEHLRQSAVDSCLLKARLGDPAIPITVYTEAAAKSTFNGHFYGSSTLDKVQPLGRNDQFTKLMGDPNKLQDGL
eukprot:gene3764-4023_t